MKKILLLALCQWLFCGAVFAQTPSVDELVDRGVSLSDNGKYIEAIQEYQHALSIDNNSPAANLEMANTYIAMQKYPKAIEYAGKVIQLNTKYVDQGYTVKGNALDMMEKLDDAVVTYKEGIKRFPTSYMLLYNAALTYFKTKQYNESAYYTAQAVTSNPAHASSHLLLAMSMAQLDKRPQSLMALYYFLLLEHGTKRADNALLLLQSQLQSGVSKTDENTINIKVAPGDMKDEFGTTNVALSLLEASKNEDKNKKKSDEQLFEASTEFFFTLLDETKEADRKKSVWWNVYVPLFHDMLASKNTEAFAYYMLSAKNSDATRTWVSGNKAKIEKFLKFREGYTKKK